MLHRVLWASIAFAVSSVTATPPPVSNQSLDSFVTSLSHAAKVYYPGSEGFANATLRWGAAQTPQYDMIVKVATEADVQKTVKPPLP